LGNFSLAWRSFWSVMGSGTLPDDLLAELGVARQISVPKHEPLAENKAKPAAAAPSVAPTATAVSEDGAVRMLALLQREGRLLDFLYEDLTPYSDEKVGAVVRGVHESCRKALDRAVQLAPVIDGVEGTVTKLASAGLKANDTARVKLMGNVPPDGKADGGILQHKGWQVKGFTMPSEDASTRERVIAPAEIEVE
jgi:Domain of unknown function (DUF2760)